MLLSRFFAHISEVDFRRDHWPEVPCEGRGDLERLPDFAAIAALDLQQLMREAGRVQIFVPFSTPVSADAAFALYRNRSFTVEIPILRHLRHVCSQLSVEIGVKAINTTLWATPAGGTGTAPHGDPWEQFIIQVRGRKTWQIARNHQLRFASVACHDGQPCSDATLGLPHGEVLSMGAEREAIVMEPGTVLFLPRGYWHTTTVDEESWHISVYVRTPTFADVLRQLLMTESWRAPFPFFAPTAEERAQIETKFSEMLRLAAESPASLGLDRVYSPPPARYQLDEAYRTSEMTAAESSYLICSAHDGDTEIELDAAMKALWETAGRLESFTLEDLVGNTTAVSLSDAKSFIDMLFDDGILHAV